MPDARTLADQLETAHRTRTPIAPPTTSGGLDIATAFEVESELARRRVASGRRIVGRKVGFANKAMWRILKLDTVVWGHMYDDTVRETTQNRGSVSVSARFSPKIEPEIVFKLRKAMPEGTDDPAVALAHVEWIALGFEIIDCLYPDWKFQPADFVAAYGLHAALMVGERRVVTADTIGTLVDALPRFTVRLAKNGEAVDEGSGKNSLKSPALCLGELAAAAARGPHATPLAAGEIISTGTLTTAQPIAAGETWSAEVDGIDLPPLIVDLDS
jgi:2-oxo-3-hexenedioate decarboxylase